MSKKDKSEAEGNPLQRVLLVVLAVLVVSFAGLLWYVHRPATASGADKLALDRVYELAANGQVYSAKLLDEDAVVVGQRCLGGGNRGSGEGDRGETPGDFPEQREPCSPPVEPFQATYPASDAATNQLVERMSRSGAEVQVAPQTLKSIARAVTTYVYPVLFLVVGFGLIFLGRGGGDSSGGIAGFGSFRKGQNNKPDTAEQGTLARVVAKLTRREPEQAPVSATTTGVTFADVGGADEAVTELREVTDYLKDPEKFAAYGAVAPKGALLFGPPGCGKTLMARAVAGEANVPFFAVSGAEFIESLVGVGAARVRDLFAQVRAVAPAIVFIDEIDAVGRKRGGEGGGGGEREQTINQLLVEMDGFEVSAGIVLMGATNRPDILDPALMRPGRFDRHVTLEPPDMAGREQILRMHAEGKPLAADVDFALLARRTPGFTGADLGSVINEAALLALRQGAGTQIDMGCFGEAVERVLHGPQRRGTLLHPEERRRLAHHESGHALVAAALGQGDSVQRVSILARGRSLGSSTIGADSSDRVLLVADEFRAKLAIAMGGIAAEGLAFAEPSTTAEDDLEKANAIAREMVGVHGMSAEIGPLRVLRGEEGFLGGDIRVVEAISGQTLGAFDAVVRARLDEARATAEDILAANRDHLEAMAGALESHETLEGEPLRTLLDAMPTADVDTPDGSGGNGHQGSRFGGRASQSGGDKHSQGSPRS